MASKLLFKNLRNLITCRNSSSFFKPQALLVNQRLYTDAAPPAPSASPAPPPAPPASSAAPPPVAAASLESEKPPPNAKKVAEKSGSVNEAELSKFASMAHKWWDEEGPFKALHAMNPTRLAFVRSTLCRHFGKDPSSPRPLQGLKIVDVGCGGGILSEPLARLGADVTGVDALEKIIDIACVHANMDPVTSSIEYRCTTAEQLVEEQKKFDAVIALEVIEHVANPDAFCKSLSALTVPGGATVISTINRSMRAYAAAIVGAEYLLQWLPKGTHDWSKFLTPEELVLILQRASISVQEVAGFVYNPLTAQWLLSDDISVDLIVFGTKNNEESIENPSPA